MKILSKKNVFEAALGRIGFLFDEFPNVVVGVSGGKDSTIVFNLAMRIASGAANCASQSRNRWICREPDRCQC